MGLIRTILIVSAGLAAAANFKPAVIQIEAQTEEHRVVRSLQHLSREQLSAAIPSLCH